MFANVKWVCRVCRSDNQPALPMDTINRVYEDPNGFNKKVKVLFLGAGGRERQSNPNIWNLHEALARAGIKSAYYESPGTAHEW